MRHPKRARTLPEVDDALAGLARAVERHSRMIIAGQGDTAALVATVEQLSRSVAAATQAWAAQQNTTSEPRQTQAADQHEGPEETEEEPTLPSWLVTTDWEAGEGLTTELTGWVRTVYLRWPDAVLPACWSLHPWVVEELWVLRCCWVTARAGDTASWLRWQDWHDRQRPATARRITEALHDCPVDQHIPASGGPYPEVPGTDVVPLAVTAWATTEHDAWPPRVSPELLADPEPTHPHSPWRSRTHGHATPIPKRTLS